MVAKHTPLVVIVGETASGKSDLAMFLAKQFNGEIIAADSRTIYKGMDIGTAKPTKQDQQEVMHHLIDIVTPEQRYSAAQFKHAALIANDKINSRGNLPIMVGGTGLYVDSVIFDYQFGQEADQRLRSELNKLTLEELQARAREIGLSEEHVNFKNKRHLQRFIERNGVVMHNKTLRPDTLILGLVRNRDTLKARITERIDRMIEAGLIDEVRQLVATYSAQNEALTSIGYRPFVKYINNELSLEEAKQAFIKGDLGLAKRQRTWFKRNKSIHWIEKQSDAVELVTTLLNNH